MFAGKNNTMEWMMFRSKGDGVMKLSERIRMGEYHGYAPAKLAAEVAQLEKKNNSARSIMEKFVFKVDTGRARSTETYGEMTEWLKEASDDN